MSVFVEKDNLIADSVVNNTVSVFENNIVPIEHTWLGTPLDVDQNKKIILLLMNIEDGYQSGGTYIAGYFDALNEFNDSDTMSALQVHSNHSEMLYLDTYPADPYSTYFYGTIAHEYQHLLQFSYNYPYSQLEDKWVDEGLSELMSDLTGFGPQTTRAEYFRFSVLSSDSLIQFNNSDPLKDYASSYMYFRYLYDVYGIGGISKVFQSPQVGATGINAALQGIDSDILNHCGNITNLSLPYFGCSYRLMWAALVSTLGAMPATVSINYDGVSGTMSTNGGNNYNWNVTDVSWRSTIATSLAAGARSRPASSTSTGNLGGYAPALFQTNFPSGSAATFSSCAGCGLTMISGSNYFAVFNHDPTTSHSASVIDTRIDVTAAAESSTFNPENLTSEEVEKPLQWHFPLKQDVFIRLRTAAQKRQVEELTDENKIH